MELTLTVFEMDITTLQSADITTLQSVDITTLQSVDITTLQSAIIKTTFLSIVFLYLGGEKLPSLQLSRSSLVEKRKETQKLRIVFQLSCMR